MKSHPVPSSFAMGFFTNSFIAKLSIISLPPEWQESWAYLNILAFLTILQVYAFRVQLIQFPTAGFFCTYHSICRNAVAKGAEAGEFAR